MAKRFTDTDKWKKQWFRKLDIVGKCFWSYILDNCNHAGIWEVDFELASFQIGEELNPDNLMKDFAKQIIVIDEGEKWFIKDFIEFQYKVSLEDLKPSSGVNRSIINSLKKYGIIVEIEESPAQNDNVKGIPYPIPLDNPLKNPQTVPPTLQDTDKDTDKDTDTDTDKVKDKDKDKGGCGGEKEELTDWYAEIRKMFISSFSRIPNSAEFQITQNLLKEYSYDIDLIQKAFYTARETIGEKINLKYIRGILNNAKGDKTKIGSFKNGKDRRLHNGDFGRDDEVGGNGFDPSKSKYSAHYKSVSNKSPGKV